MSQRHHTDCREWRDRLSAVHDGEARSDPALEAHLLECEACRDFAGELPVLSARIEALSCREAPREGWRAIRARLPRDPASFDPPARPSPGPRLVHVLQAAAALLLGFVAVRGAFAIRHGRPEATVADTPIVLPSPWAWSQPESAVAERLSEHLENAR